MRKISPFFLACLLSTMTLLGCGVQHDQSTQPITPTQIVAAAKANLAVGFAPGDSLSALTHDVTLPAVGTGNSTITWSSSNPAVVSAAGVVRQPVTGDANVILTATITMEGVSDTKTFPVTVKAQMTEAQALAAAKTAVAVGFAPSDAGSSVTQNLTLPTASLDGSTVTWSSSDPSVVSASGVIHQPLIGDATVTLTATITVGGVSDTKTFVVTIKAQMTETQAVAAAKAAVAVGFAPSDGGTSVTQNLTLPTTGMDGSTVTWSSSHPSVVSASGVIHPPLTGDATVTLTATITVGGVSDTKTFVVVVKAQMSDAVAVAAAKAALAIEFAHGDSASSVTQALMLPSTGIDNSIVTWSSSNPAVVSPDGHVHRPTNTDANVTLTATITVGSASDTKGFPLTVKFQVSETQAMVAAAKADLAIAFAGGDDASSVTQNLTLPTTSHGATVTWSSSDPTVIDSAGLVTQPLTGDANVTLTATITAGSDSDTKLFPLVVKAQMTDAQAVAAAKAALAIGYASGDADSTVTQNLTLPTTGIDNTSVTWSPSDAAISSAGVVTQPLTTDLPVTLTATITSHSVSDTKDFIVIVKAQMTDAQAVAAAKAALALGYALGDNASSVTQNLTLPLTGSNACTVSWNSSDGSIISNAGVVSQPATGDASVTLTATITSHSESDTAAFPLTVKGQMSDADAVAAAKAALNITYGSGDSAINVTQNLTLPATGSNGTTISWTSTDPSVVSNAGVVTQPVGSDSAITLTATITSHATSDTKDFALTVKAVMDDAGAVANDKAALVIGFGPGDSGAQVTRNLVLPTSGTNGTDISWASSDPDTITASGGVTVPTDSDKPVTLTATISRGLATDTAIFNVTVKALLLSSWVDVNAISPGNGAIEVDPGIAIAIPFQRALDANTVNDTTFQILKTSNSQPVAITVLYDAPSQTVTLTPQSPLEEGTQYSTVIATSLADSGETNLPNAMGFNFTTLSYASILSQWKFNGDGNDSSGNGNVLTLVGGSYSAMAHEGSDSLYLNGAFQYGNSNINLGTQLTVAVWVNVDNPIKGSIDNLMANTGTGEGSNGFKMGINRWGTSDESVVIEVGNGSTGGKWITDPGLIQPGNWYHLAFVIDQPHSTMKIYYNGVEAPLHFVSDEGRQQAQFAYNFKTTGPFTIGAFQGGSYTFKGHLDDMRVYNRVLSAEEISKMAQEK